MKFLSMLPVAMARFSADSNAICYVFLVFVDEIMFSHNAQA